MLEYTWKYKILHYFASYLLQNRVYIIQNTYNLQRNLKTRTNIDYFGNETS